MEVKCKNCGTVHYLADNVGKVITITEKNFEKIVIDRDFSNEKVVEAISYDYKCDSCNTMMSVMFK